MKIDTTRLFKDMDRQKMTAGALCIRAGIKPNEFLALIATGTAENNVGERVLGLFAEPEEGVRTNLTIGEIKDLISSEELTVDEALEAELGQDNPRTTLLTWLEEQG